MKLYIQQLTFLLFTGFFGTVMTTQALTRTTQTDTNLSSTIANQVVEINALLEQVEKHSAQDKNFDSLEIIHYLQGITQSLDIQNIREFNETKLSHLTNANEALINEIIHYAEKNSINYISILEEPAQKSVENLSSENITQAVERLQKKIAYAQKSIKELNLSSFNKAMRSVDTFATNYHAKTIIKRALPYLLYSLYILRQHRDDYEKWNNPVLKYLKKIVGCPNKKAPMITTTTSDIKTLGIDAIKEAHKEAKAAGFKIQTTGNGRDCNFLTTWFGISFKDDKLFVIPFTTYFIKHVQEDLASLSKWSRKKWSKIETVLFGEEL